MSAIAASNPVPRIDTTTVVAVAVTVVAWASAFPAIRAGLGAFGPVELGAMRFAIAAVPSAIFLAWTRPALPSWSEAWRFVFGGLVFVGRAFVFCVIAHNVVRQIGSCAAYRCLAPNNQGRESQSNPKHTESACRLG